MPMRLTTRAQVSGHRFLLRRMTGALVRRDARLLHEPMRTQTRAALGGAVLGVLGIAGFAVWGLFSKPAVLGEEPLVLARDSGTLHLRVDDRLHPVTDLASARLILGEPVSPTVVPDTVLDDLDRGPLVGVLGGPGRLPDPDREIPGVWTLCRHDGEAGLSLILGGQEPADPHAATVLGADSAVLVRSGDDTHLLWDGGRSRVDAGDLPVLRALGLAETTPAVVPTELLDALPERAAVTVPQIPGAGTTPARRAAGESVGDVITTDGADGAARHHLVLADGLQEVGPVAAELIRYGGGRQLRLGAERIAGVPGTQDPLALGHLPATVPEVRADPDVLCVRWSAPESGGARAQTAVLAGRELPVPDSHRTAIPAQTEATVRAVHLPAGAGVFVRLHGTGAEGGTVVVTDTGVRHGVPTDAVEALGLGAEPVFAPWPMLALLPAGPDLRTHDALVVRDTATAPPADGILAAED